MTEPDDLEDDSQQPVITVERHPAGFQRALRWIAWLTFVGLAIRNSQRASFGGLELLALAAAVGISIWCMARPLGGQVVEMTKPVHVRGEFVSRTSWGLVLFGAILTIGGVAASASIAYDLSTGRATVGDVLRDIAIFVEGWTVEIITGGGYDAELEKTHAYALFALLLPGIALLWVCLTPFFRRGRQFRVEPDTSISIRDKGEWIPLLDYEYSAVAADGTTIRFNSAHDGGPDFSPPQPRVFSREYDTRLKADLSAEFFRQRLTGRGFSIDATGSK